MPNSEDLQHAEHNEKVFRHLLQNKDFADWIVTTAFYSSLHYVDYKLFPITHTEKKIQVKIVDMESYAVSALNKYGNDKHVCRLKLVQSKLKEIAFEFNWLYSTCKTARYHDYKFADPDDICKTSEDYLKAIKEFVTKKEVKK